MGVCRGRANGLRVGLGMYCCRSQDWPPNSPGAGSGLFQGDCSPAPREKGGHRARGPGRTRTGRWLGAGRWVGDRAGRGQRGSRLAAELAWPPPACLSVRRVGWGKGNLKPRWILACFCILTASLGLQNTFPGGLQAGGTKAPWNVPLLSGSTRGRGRPRAAS